MQRTPFRFAVQCLSFCFLTLWLVNTVNAQNINVEAKFPEAYEKMAINIPGELTGSEVHVHNMGDESHCASLALQRFKFAVNEAAKNRAMAKAWDRTMSLAKLLPLGALIGHGLDIADLIEKAFTSPDAESFINELKKSVRGKLIDYGGDKGREVTHNDESATLDISFEAAKQLFEGLTSEVENESIDGPVDNAPCGKVSLLIKIMPPNEQPHPEPGKGIIQMNVYTLHFDATGDCQCQYKAGDPVKLQNWHVWGDLPIKVANIQVTKKAVKITFEYGTPEYYVLAQCKCGQPNPPTYTVPPKPKPEPGSTIPVYERICDQYCHGYFDAMMNASKALFDLNTVAKDLKTKIADIDAKIKSLNDNITDWQAKMDKANKGLSDDQKFLNDLNNRIAKTNSRSDKQALEGEKTTTTGKIDKDNKNIKDLKDKIDNAKGQVKKLQDQRNQLSSSLNALNQEISRTQKIYDDAVAAYENCLKNCYKNAANSRNPEDKPYINGNETTHERNAKNSLTNSSCSSLFIGPSTIFEDSYTRFNTYGVDAAYTHPLSASVGITADAGVHIGSNAGISNTKIQLLGGVSLIPPGGNMVSFSPHLLIGISDVSNKFSSGLSFSAAAGSNISFPINNNISFTGRVDYNPAFSSGGVSNNFRVGVGLSFKTGCSAAK